MPGGLHSNVHHIYLYTDLYTFTDGPKIQFPFIYATDDTVVCLLWLTLCFPDIDECALQTHTCWNDSVCVNLPGGYDCVCTSGPGCSGDCPQEEGIRRNGEDWKPSFDRCAICSCKVQRTNTHQFTTLCNTDEGFLTQGFHSSWSSVSLPWFPVTKSFLPSKFYTKIKILDGVSLTSYPKATQESERETTERRDKKAEH